MTDVIICDWIEIIDVLQCKIIYKGAIDILINCSLLTKLWIIQCIITTNRYYDE